jgi:chromosome segregation ATPase
MSASVYQEGLTVLRKIVEDERNWRSGMAQIETLLNAAEVADKALANNEKRKAQLEADIARLEKAGKQYEASVKEVQSKLATFSEDLAAREALAQERLSVINEKIVVAQKQLDEPNQAVRRLTKIGASVS